MRFGKFTRLLLLVLVVAVSMVLVTACGGGSKQPAGQTGQQTTGGQEPSVKEEPKEPIKIGVLFAKTGRMEPFESSYAEGAVLAFEEVNKAGGINGRQIEPVVYDNESNPEVAIARVKKLVNEDKVTAIVGPGTSYTDNPVLPTVDELKIPSVVVSGGMHFMQPLPKYTFSVEAGGYFVAQALGEYWKREGIKNFVLLTTADSTGEGAVKELQAMSDDYGIEMLAKEQRPGTDTEFTAAWTKLLANKPQAVVVYGSSPAWITPAMNNLADLGWDGPMGYIGAARLTALMKGISKIAGKNFQGPTFKVRVYDQLSPKDPARDRILAFVDAYKVKYNKEPELAANGYVAAMQIADALKAVGPDKEKIRDYLENLKDWKGVNGLDFSRSATDHEGITHKDLIVSSWDADAQKFVLTDYVVAP